MSDSRAVVAAVFILLPLLAETRAATRPLTRRSGVVEIRRQAAGDWRLVVARDRFSGDVQCRLKARDGRSIYVAQAVGFRFARHLDVTDAWFRIDEALPIRWRNVLPDLARSGVAIDGRELDSPTGGVVWVPSALLTDADRIAIQPVPGYKPRSFRLHGFAALQRTGRELGCIPETRFVR